MKSFTRTHAVKGLPLLIGALGLAVGCHRPDPAALSPVPAAQAAAIAPLASPVYGPAGAGLDVASLVARVKPSVVNITAEHDARATPAQMPEGLEGSPFEYFFRQGPGGSPGTPSPRKQRALGSGFIVDGQGHVVTNAHVVEGSDTVRVKLADEREFKATVRGRDERLDLAVLEIEGAKDLPFVPLGTSDTVKVGEYVIAIGNPFGLGHTVTMGIVSAKGREIGAGPYDDFIQTDASINPGNSGGPLFDARGEVVGINTAINPNGQGIGFAIPADALRQVLPQLIKDGHVDRGRLGVRIQAVDEKLARAMNLGEPKGALAADVEKGGPAEAAGIQNGDLIVAVDGAEVRRAQDLPRIVAGHAPGTKAQVKILRDGKERTFAVTLAALDEGTKKRSSNGGASDAPSHDESVPRGALGVAVEDGRDGVLVRRVLPGGPAEGALVPGDTIVSVNRESVRSARELTGKIQAAPTDKPLLLQVKREGASRFVAIDRG